MLCVTRFNNKTLGEFDTFRRNNEDMNTIYNSPSRMKDQVRLNYNFILFEMNNDTNKIMGISIVKNKPFMRKHNIYSDNNYNRFSFESSYRIDLGEINDTEKENIEKIEKMIFKGKGHLKRGSGITVCGDKSFNIYNLNKMEITSFFQQMFKDRNNNIVI
jgi:hypothetical protein